MHHCIVNRVLDRMKVFYMKLEVSLSTLVVFEILPQ